MTQSPGDSHGGSVADRPRPVNGQGSARTPTGGEPPRGQGPSQRGGAAAPPGGGSSHGGGGGGALGRLPGGASTLLVLGLVVVLGAAFAIGFSIANSDDGGSGGGSTTLTADHLARYASGSPERAVVEWWRDIQFGNPSRVETHYSSEAGASVDEIELQLSQQGSFFDGIPRIDDVNRNGEIATVYALVVGASANPEPVALRLVREGGEWKLADNHLLEELVAQRERAGAIGEGEAAEAAGAGGAETDGQDRGADTPPR